MSSEKGACRVKVAAHRSLACQKWIIGSLLLGTGKPLTSGTTDHVPKKSSWRIPLRDHSLSSLHSVSIQNANPPASCPSKERNGERSNIYQYLDLNCACQKKGLRPSAPKITPIYYRRTNSQWSNLTSETIPPGKTHTK